MCFTGLSKQAKLDNCCLILSSSQFSLLSQLSQKMELTSKVVIPDWKIIISLPRSKPVKVIINMQQKRIRFRTLDELGKGDARINLFSKYDKRHLRLFMTEKWFLEMVLGSR